jgi:hypothetical protein
MSLPIATESSTVMPDLNDEMDVENERGQGASRIAGHPKVQENSPHDLEGRVPNSVLQPSSHAWEPAANYLF